MMQSQRVLLSVTTIKKSYIKKDCSKWKVEKGKGKENEPKEKKKSSMNIISWESDAYKVVSIEVHFTSNMGSILLIAFDGYTLSDWILDSRTSLHTSLPKEWFTSYATTKDHVRLGNE